MSLSASTWGPPTVVPVYPTDDALALVSTAQRATYRIPEDPADLCGAEPPSWVRNFYGGAAHTLGITGCIGAGGCPTLGGLQHRASEGRWRRHHGLLVTLDRDNLPQVSGLWPWSSEDGKA